MRIAYLRLNRRLQICIEENLQKGWTRFQRLGGSPHAFDFFGTKAAMRGVEDLLV